MLSVLFIQTHRFIKDKIEFWFSPYFGTFQSIDEIKYIEHFLLFDVIFCSFFLFFSLCIFMLR